MLRKAAIVLSLTIGMVLPACRKDHPIEDEGQPADCVPTPPTPMQGWNFHVPQHAINGPRFSPNDGDEILFVERPFGSQTDYKLWRYRISGTATTEVLSGSNLVNMAVPADWGSNGWILLNLRGPDSAENIFKVKTNGDSLTQLTITGSSFSPIWSPSSSYFGYSKSDGPSYSVKVDAETGSTDTLIEVPLNSSSCWYDEDMVASVGLSGVFIGQAQTDQMTRIAEMPEDLYDFASPAGIVVLPDDQTILWMHTGGLYSTDMNSGTTEQVFKTCNSQYFVGLDYSPQTNKLLTTRITRTPVNDHDLLIATDIVLMNPDGTGQEVLNIPFPE